MKVPKYIKVDWTTKPTEFDSIGCDGMYLKCSPRVKYWGWPFLLWKMIQCFPFRDFRFLFTKSELEKWTDLKKQ